jgi:hypothetical protein
VTLKTLLEASTTERPIEACLFEACVNGNLDVPWSLCQHFDGPSADNGNTERKTSGARSIIVHTRMPSLSAVNS